MLWIFHFHSNVKNFLFSLLYIPCDVDAVCFSCWTLWVHTISLTQFLSLSLSIRLCPRRFNLLINEITPYFYITFDSVYFAKVCVKTFDCWWIATIVKRKFTFLQSRNKWMKIRCTTNFELFFFLLPLLASIRSSGLWCDSMKSSEFKSITTASVRFSDDRIESFRICQTIMWLCDSTPLQRSQLYRYMFYAELCAVHITFT